MNREILDLAERVVKLLTSQGVSIVCVESCTGGGLANAITNIPGAGDVLFDSFITYSNEAKIRLGVPAEVIGQHTVYSLETAGAMAKAGLSAAVNARVGVGITGSISRPDPANPSSSPGNVYIAVTCGSLTIKQPCTFSDKLERWQAKDEIILLALKMVLNILE